METGDHGPALGLKEIVGSLVFGSGRPISIREIRKCLVEVAEGDPEAAAFAKADDDNIAAALAEIRAALERAGTGFALKEAAGGFRLESDAKCGRWLKHLLQIGRPRRLSAPGLETLAIIAHRQPVTRAQIEAIRGVSADHVIRVLLETQLVRIVGRSTLPGRPFLFGTTQLFLEHFGLKDLSDLEKVMPAFAVASQEGGEDGA